MIAQTCGSHLDFFFKRPDAKIELSYKEGGNEMILDMLKRDNVRVINQSYDWKDAIAVSLEPLVEQGFVTEEYSKNIIKITEEYGPYYVLTDNVALIHGRPEMGVLKKQLAVTVLKQPAYFGDDKQPVRLMVALAATDPDSHIDVMQTLAEVFMNEEVIQKIIESDSTEEIYQYFLDAEKAAQEQS